MGNCKWIVNVQLHQFQNKYNAELKDNVICCCDTPKKSMCGSDTNHLVENLLKNDTNNSNSKCDDRCDTWFEVTLSPCQSEESLNCTRTTFTTASRNAGSVIEFGFLFHFESTVSPKNVSQYVLKPQTFALN